MSPTLPISPHDLIARAQELEDLAKLVSYAPDKARLKQRATRLRQQAREALPN